MRADDEAVDTEETRLAVEINYNTTQFRALYTLPFISHSVGLIEEFLDSTTNSRLN